MRYSLPFILLLSTYLKYHALLILYDNIRMDLREVGLEGVDWIHLSQDSVWWRALANAVINLGLHKKQGIFGRTEYYQFLKNDSASCS
jgi:hypothetical protein